MASRTLLFGCGALAVTFSLAVGCGTDAGSGFNENGDDDSDGGGKGGGGIGASGGLGGGDGGGGTSGQLGDGSACEASSARAVRPPLTMIMGLDQSCSMGDCGGGTQKAKRWVPVTTALKAFWSNPITSGISADLRLFPNGNGAGQYCSFGTYTTPVVPLTALPNSPAFEAVLVDNPQKTATPTRAVLRAMATEATGLLTADASAKVVVVLVTDGKPQFCEEDDALDKVVGEISGKPFKTYVIAIKGTGDSTIESNANAIAAAGGTETAYLVDTNDPNATQTAFTTAIDEIRGALVPSCEVAIPPPPAGKSFDKTKVNVTVTSGTTPTQLGYDPTCAGAGWKYDNEAAPTTIVLCPQTCEPFKVDPTAQVDVAFGCVTQAAGVH